jgi:hypothetical protein
MFSASSPGRVLGGLFLLDKMQARAVLFPHLFCRNNFATKVGKSHEFMLDSLQSFIPPTVTDLSICWFPSVTPKLLICLLDVGDLISETPDFVAKNH